jgi:hypothetical protein
VDQWEEKLACALVCHRCNTGLAADEKRILSVYDHEPICLVCKQAEEQRQDYASVSRSMIGTCMAETEIMYSDPSGYCFHHFYPFTCK